MGRRAGIKRGEGNQRGPCPTGFCRRGMDLDFESVCKDLYNSFEQLTNMIFQSENNWMNRDWWPGKC